MITVQQARIAAGRFSIIPFFPEGEGARLELTELFMQMVETPEQLAWLVGTATGRMDRWAGLREVRAIYCVRFKPKDGKEEDSNIPGFTPSDSESQTLAATVEIKRIEAERPRIAGGLQKVIRPGSLPD